MHPITITITALVVAASASAQSERWGRLGPDTRGRLEALQVDPSALSIDVRSGQAVAQRIAGPLPLRGTDVLARSADLARRFGVLFGAGANAEYAAPRVTGRHRTGAVRDVWVA